MKSVHLVAWFDCTLNSLVVVTVALVMTHGRGRLYCNLLILIRKYGITSNLKSFEFENQDT